MLIIPYFFNFSLKIRLKNKDCIHQRFHIDHLLKSVKIPAFLFYFKEKGAMINHNIISKEI